MVGRGDKAAVGPADQGKQDELKTKHNGDDTYSERREKEKEMPCYAVKKSEAVEFDCVVVEACVWKWSDCYHFECMRVAEVSSGVIVCHSPFVW